MRHSKNRILSFSNRFDEEKEREGEVCWVNRMTLLLWGGGGVECTGVRVREEGGKDRAQIRIRVNLDEEERIDTFREKGTEEIIGIAAR